MTAAVTPVYREPRSLSRAECDDPSRRVHTRLAAFVSATTTSPAAPSATVAASRGAAVVPQTRPPPGPTVGPSIVVGTGRRPRPIDRRSIGGAPCGWECAPDRRISCHCGAVGVEAGGLGRARVVGPRIVHCDSRKLASDGCQAKRGYEYKLERGGLEGHGTPRLFARGRGRCGPAPPAATCYAAGVSRPNSGNE